MRTRLRAPNRWRRGYRGGTASPPVCAQRSAEAPTRQPGLSYLGGLPPLFFIAGDKEVLRDEIIYACVIFLALFF
jgi:acetyl esterase/lipase